MRRSRARAGFTLRRGWVSSSCVSRQILGASGSSWPPPFRPLTPPECLSRRGIASRYSLNSGLVLRVGHLSRVQIRGQKEFLPNRNERLRRNRRYIRPRRTFFLAWQQILRGERHPKGESAICLTSQPFRGEPRTPLDEKLRGREPKGSPSQIPRTRFSCSRRNRKHEGC